SNAPPRRSVSTRLFPLSSEQRKRFCPGEGEGTLMTQRAVHWHEGMFIRPHHFQTAQRYEQYLADRSEKWDLHYNWGIRNVELDLDALSNYRLVVRRLDARMRDGTVVSIPEDGALPPLDLKPAFEQGANNITVNLAVPIANLGKAN